MSFAWPVKRCQCRQSVIYLPDYNGPRDPWYLREVPVEVERGEPREIVDQGQRWRVQAFVREVDRWGWDTAVPTIEVLAPEVEANDEEPVWLAHWGLCSSPRAKEWRARFAYAGGR